ncbi:MAG: hypothetical protein WCD66_13870 [Rhodanobacteraceae bacterium]
MKQTCPARWSGIVLGIALLTTQPALGRDQPSHVPPCEGAQHHQFDFWIGNWQVTNPAGKVVGHNRVERIENGCGIQENWRSTTGVTGRSINAWSRQDGRWHQTWLGSGGMLLQLAGGLRDGSMVLEGKTAGADGKNVRQRISWTPQANGRVRQHWQQSRDGGESWTTVFDGLYTRSAQAKTEHAGN